MKSTPWPRYASPKKRLALAKNLNASAAGLREIFGAEKAAMELEELARVLYSADHNLESGWEKRKPKPGRPRSSQTAEKEWLAGLLATVTEIKTGKCDYDLIRKVVEVKKGHDRQLVQRVPDNVIALFKLLAEIDSRNSKAILSRKTASS